MNKHITKDQPHAFMRPYEKQAVLGAEGLSDAELLAIIIRSGTRDRDALGLAEELLTLYGNRDGLLNLMYFSQADFQSIKGIGPVKAAQLCAISELSKRIWKARAVHSTAFPTPSSIADYFKEELRYCHQEKVMLLLLDSKHRLIRSLTISQGTVNASLISPREIFYEAIRYRAAFFAVVHNHPSGCISPSAADREFASILFVMGRMMNIHLLDCIIIGDNEFLSFSEAGLLRDSAAQSF